MAERSFPFDNSASYESDWRAMSRLWANGGDGVVAGELNELRCYGDATGGLNVKISTGRAWVNGTYYENDALITKTLSTAPGTNSRIDRVILRNDFANNQITVEVLTGVAAASPVAPALTQTSVLWEIELAQVRVGTSVTLINATDVFDKRQYVSPIHPGLFTFPATTI